MRIAILGYGREGKSTLKFLKKQPKYKKAEFVILDQKTDKNYLGRLKEFDLVFRSPGVPYNLPEIKKAIKNGVKFSSATKLFFEHCPAKIIGITGTKGKGTTSTLLYEMLKSCDKKVFLAGNIGKPALDILSKIDRDSVVILELSSFQLQDLEKPPHLAVVVDTFPDHLDAHKNVKEYLDAKANIAKFQKKTDAIFYFEDNAWSKRVALASPARKIGIYGEPFGLKKNLVMAATVAAYLDCHNEKSVQSAKKFRGVAHRLEFVCEVGGVKFYNDSAGTNPQTAAAAIRYFSDTLNPKRCPLILIAGGKDKGLDYSPLAQAIQESPNVRAVVLFGENKQKIAKAISGIRKREPAYRTGRLRITEVKNLTEAVKQSRLYAKRYTLNAIILFSPASASFDMFADYKERGEQFKDIVKKLKS